MLVSVYIYIYLVLASVHHAYVSMNSLDRPLDVINYLSSSQVAKTVFRRFLTNKGYLQKGV